MEYQTQILKNGLRIIHKQSQSNVSYCGFIINAGTRDEQEYEYGMAHFVEHMLFKGTKKRKSYHIINRMEKVGGELNAFTNKEETVIYATFLDEDLNRAIDLLSDVVFNSTFPQNEIDKEINVVIDEIHSYEDSPAELIYDEFENLMFNKSQLGHNILGEENILESFDNDKTKIFYNSFYYPENMVFFFLGKSPLKQIIKCFQKQDFIYKNLNTEQKRIQTDKTKGIIKVEEKNTNQGHVMLGFNAYALGNPKRKTLQLLNNILGGTAMNSRLNMRLREKKGYVYNIDSNFTSYTDTGLLSIYLGCDLKNIDKCIDLVNKEIDILKKNKLTESQLANAKKQMIGQICIATEYKENIALSLGKSYLHFNKYDSLEEVIQKINGITANDILDVANELFSENDCFQLVYK